MSFKFNTSVSDALYHLYTHFFQFYNCYAHNIIVLKCKRSHLFFQRLTSFLESGRKSFLNNVKVIESGFSIKMMFQNYFPRLHLSQQVMMITTTTTKEKFFTDGCTLMFFLFLLFTEKLSPFYPDLFLKTRSSYKRCFLNNDALRWLWFNEPTWRKKKIILVIIKTPGKSFSYYWVIQSKSESIHETLSIPLTFKFFNTFFFKSS